MPWGRPHTTPCGCIGGMTAWGVWRGLQDSSQGLVSHLCLRGMQSALHSMQCIGSKVLFGNLIRKSGRCDYHHHLPTITITRCLYVYLPGDYLLIGIDRRNAAHKVAAAYNDSKGGLLPPQPGRASHKTILIVVQQKCMYSLYPMCAMWS